MNKYNVEIEILTPVHIWNGKTLSGIDYFCLQKNLGNTEKTKDWKEITKKAFLYKFKMVDFIEKVLWEKEKKEFMEKLEKWSDKLDLRVYIFNLLQDLDKQKKFESIARIKIPITNSFYKLWKQKIVWKPRKINGKTQEKVENEIRNQLSQLNIKEFVNTLWRYYIPWSSLKWAIRTVLTNKNIEKNINSKIDPFKKLIVRDSNFSKNIEIWKLARQSQKWDWIYAEFLKPWEKLTTEIIVKNFLDEKELEKINFSKENICKKANNYTKTKIEKYISELKKLKYHPELQKNNSQAIKKKKKLDSAIDSFKKILDKIENIENNECILNIWFWWWYWFKLLEEIEESHPSYFRVKHLKDESIQISRTNWQIDLENLWFIKLTFKD